MSAKAQASPYPRDDKYYENLAYNYESVLRLIASNPHFQKDIERIRAKYKLYERKKRLDDEYWNFEPRPYVPGKKEPKTVKKAPEADVKDDPEFIRDMEEIALKVPHEGDMVLLVREYALLNEHLVIGLFVAPRKELIPSIEVDESGKKYVNLKLYGPLTVKDLEAWWYDIRPLINEIHPNTGGKKAQHKDTYNHVWVMYELRKVGLSDAEIAETVNAHFDTYYIYKEVNTKLRRLEQRIDKSYRHDM